MMKGRFGYHAVHKPGKESEPTSLIVAWVEADSPLRAVLWSRPERKWVYAPAIAARRLYDDQYFDTTKPVDRQTAERIAEENLGTTLPSEEELRRMCEEGASSGQVWGPPTLA